MTTITAKPTIITTPTGIAYRRQVITDSWGRQRVCDKRLDDLPKPHAEACECCGQSIAGDRSTKRFCSDACKMKAYRQRRQAKG